MTAFDARDDREGKLPRWAQSLLADYRRELAATEQQRDELLAELRPPEETSEVVYVQHLRFTERPLPPGSSVEFGLHKDGDPTRRGRSIRCRVAREESSHDDRVFLDINADSGVIIKPMAGNSFRLYFERP